MYTMLLFTLHIWHIMQYYFFLYYTTFQYFLLEAICVCLCTAGCENIGNKSSKQKTVSLKRQNTILHSHEKRLRSSRQFTATKGTAFPSRRGRGRKSKGKREEGRRTLAALLGRVSFIRVPTEKKKKFRKRQNTAATHLSSGSELKGRAPRRLCVVRSVGRSVRKVRISWAGYSGLAMKIDV